MTAGTDTLRGPVLLAGALLALSLIAWLSPPPPRPTDQGVYEATAARGIVPGCVDVHCFRVLVAWGLGVLPGPSPVKWKAYAVLSTAVTAIAVFHLGVVVGLTRRGGMLAAFLSAFGFGALYTLHDPYTSDPFIFALSPLLTLMLFRERVLLTGAVASVGVLAKEFAAAPLFIVAGAAWLGGEWRFGWRVFAAGAVAFAVWAAFHLILILQFGYGYGNNPSVRLLGGGYMAWWLDHLSLTVALSAIVGVFGALWVLAPAGLWLAPPTLARLAWASIPVALLFAYVQQPDRAWWNFHFVATPLAAFVLERVPLWLALLVAGTFAAANLRVGAQLPFVPAARFALAASMALAVTSIIVAWRRGAFDGAPPLAGVSA